LASWQSVVL